MNNNYQKIFKWIVYYGSFIILLLGTLFHFLHNGISKNVIFSLISPVNESIWEHLKLVFYPTLIYWIVLYFILRKKIDISINPWIKAMTVSTIVGMLIVVFLYYGIVGAFGLESVVVDLLIYFIAIVIAQLFSVNVYQISTNSSFSLYISLFIILLFVVSFAIFTYSPPKIPLFYDHNSGQYGL